VSVPLAAAAAAAAAAATLRLGCELDLSPKLHWTDSEKPTVGNGFTSCFTGGLPFDLHSTL